MSGDLGSSPRSDPPWPWGLRQKKSKLCTCDWGRTSTEIHPSALWGLGLATAESGVVVTWPMGGIISFSRRNPASAAPAETRRLCVRRLPGTWLWFHVCSSADSQMFRWGLDEPPPPPTPAALCSALGKFHPTTGPVVTTGPSVFLK